MDRDKPCSQRVSEEFQKRIVEIKKLWEGVKEGDEAMIEEFLNYALSFDYVPSGTFADEKRGFFQWVLSFGGPGDEFRFFCDPELSVYCIEYWVLDWNDGACLEVKGKDFDLLEEIFSYFKEIGMVEKAIQESR